MILFAVPLLVLMMLIVIIPASPSGSGAQFGIEGGKTLLGTGDKLSEDDDDAIRLFSDGSLYSATLKIVDSNGVTQSGAVDPTSYYFSNGADKALTITAPSTPGSYRLEVEFRLTSNSDSERVIRTYPIKVVEPIILSIVVENTSKSIVTGLVLQFVIDGKAMDPEKVDNEYRKYTVNPESTETIEYRWVTASVSGGKHTYRVQVHEDSTPMAGIEGLNKDYQFYIGQSDYGWMVWIMAILTVVIFLVLIWVIRKPVKNFGKPKGRR